MPALPPLPTTAPLLQTKADGSPSDYISDDWYTWYFDLWTRLLNIAAQAAPIALTGQTAAIGSTTLAAAAGAGLFRVSYVIRVAIPASVSSSLQIQFNWTRAGVPLSFTGAALVANTTATWQQGSFVARIDAATLNMLTNYASVGTAMAYEIDVTVEQLS